MKKLYHLSWQHITGITGALQTDQIFEFYERFSELIEDEHVSNDSIVFHSEEVPLESLKEAENTLVVDRVAEQRELDLNMFIKNKLS